MLVYPNLVPRVLSHPSLRSEVSRRVGARTWERDWVYPSEKHQYGDRNVTEKYVI